MKTLYLFFVLALAGISANAQTVWSSDMSSWASGVPTDWMGTTTNIDSNNVVEVTTGASAGTSAAQLINVSNSHKRFTTKGFQVTANVPLEVKIWAKGKGDLRTNIWDAAYESYNTYLNIDDTVWTMYTQTVTPDSSFAMTELILSVRGTDSTMGHIMIDSVWVGNATAANKTIYEIQYTTLSTGISPLEGQLVSTKGIVTAVGGNGYFIQDGDSAWSGLWVFDPNNTPTLGDSVELTGTVKEWFGLTELDAPTSYSVLSSGNTLPNPVMISTGATEEKYESVYVGVMGSPLSASDTFDVSGMTVFNVNDGSGMLSVQDLFYQYPNPTSTIINEIYGPLNFSWDTFRIAPRGASDVILTLEELTRVDATIGLQPNPAVSNVQITGLEADDELTLLSMDGKLIHTQVAFAGLIDIQVSDLNRGVYFINIRRGTQLISKKLVLR
ncbi:MAG: T9SS type A sorting domain-containing protein [Flavobacteriales bacterium]|nr:T9SS type A sorting domain-containing protein [Flavobacteriales bacterium]